MRSLLALLACGGAVGAGAPAAHAEVAASETSSNKADIVVGAGGGFLYVDKQAATPVTGVSGAFEVSVGARLHPRSLIKVRLLGFRADGNNAVLALGGELDLVGAFLGVTAAAGFSMGADSRGGNFAGFGAFARAPLGSTLALRLDVAANTVARNDFSGIGLSSLVSVEMRWAR